MTTAEDVERTLVGSIGAGSRFESSVDALVSHLLASVAGYPGRATDGVVFEHSRVSGREVAASGVVVMIDQTVEPLRVELTLDASGGGLSSGRVCFGDATRTVGYGSREHGRLRNEILAEPDTRYSWKDCFRRDPGGWRRDSV